MGGGSQPSTQTITNKTELPPWLEGITKENLALADEISKRPYQAYGGQLVAGFSPEQEQAFQYAAGGIGMNTPVYNQAINSAAGTSIYNPLAVQAGQTGYQAVTPQNFLTGDVNAYMNPYVQNVEQAALSRLEGATKQAVNRVGDQALAARAFGGSRQGIAEGVTLGEAARSAGELSANLRSQAYQDAAARMQADQNRALQADLANQQAGLQSGMFNVNQLMQAQQLNQAAGLQGAQTRLAAATQLGNLANQAQQARTMDTATLEAIGQQRQAMAQQALDEAYARYMEQKNYPIEALNLRLGATTATPYATTSTQTRTGMPTGSNFLTGLGAVGSAASTALAIASLASM